MSDPAGPVEIAWLEWGDPKARPVVCAHGLTRNAHDFDALAAALADAGAFVLAVDVPGRGRSGRLSDPTDYAVPVYARLLNAWLAALGLGRRVAWVGTSMGGLIGMALAAGEAAPIDRLVLNDIGPFIPKAALELIAAYAGTDPRFASLDDLEAHLRLIHAPFGPLSDDQWRHLATHSGVEGEDGLWRLRYDPAIRAPMRAGEIADVDLWPLYDAISCPTLVLRGAESTLLLPETAQAMTERGPKAELATIEGTGHAPALMAEDQIGAVRTFLGL